MSNICIVLGTYNGSKYLKDQINSLLDQQNISFEILSRDDGSQDNSSIILKGYSNQDPRISLIQDDRGNLGVTDNFSLLLKEAAKSSCEYISCTDQDDIWNPNKLAEQVALMRKAEMKYPDKPILVHSDLEVVDANLNSIGTSFMRYNGIQHESLNPINVLLPQNFVTGCTVLFNRPLLEIALPIPKEAILHDWWLALCAAAFGRIEYIKKPLVKYRQHENNNVGARSILDSLNPVKTNWFCQWLEGKEVLLQSIEQAEVLSRRIKKDDPANPHLSLIEGYASLRRLSSMQRVKKLARLGVRAQGFMRHSLLLSRLLCLPVKSR